MPSAGRSGSGLHQRGVDQCRTRGPRPRSAPPGRLRAAVARRASMRHCLSTAERSEGLAQEGPSPIIREPPSAAAVSSARRTARRSSHLEGIVGQRAGAKGRERCGSSKVAAVAGAGQRGLAGRKVPRHRADAARRHARGTDDAAGDVQRDRHRDQRELEGRAVAHLEEVRATGCGAAGTSTATISSPGRARCPAPACRRAGGRTRRSAARARPRGGAHARGRRARPARPRGPRRASPRSGGCAPKIGVQPVLAARAGQPEPGARLLQGRSALRK